MPQDPQKLAEKIAKLLDNESQSPDLAAIYAAMEKINHRLEKLERGGSVSALPLSSLHPSLEKFSIAEAIADEIFAGVRKEKACQFEPGKPCDHCSMCNSRGF